jgi:hypothetical protein
MSSIIITQDPQRLNTRLLLPGSDALLAVTLLQVLGKRIRESTKLNSKALRFGQDKGGYKTD